MKNPVAWFEIYVDDMERAKTFYESMLGVQLARLDSPIQGMELWSFPMQSDSYGASGALVKMPGYTAGGSGALIYFGCEDCAVEAAKAVRAGGRIQTEKMSIGQYGAIALVIDTEGNLIGLHSMQ